jgi:hypothetical protein
MDNELNDDWIINFEETDKLYKDFYKDNLDYINIDFIYINDDNEIEKIKQDYLKEIQLIMIRGTLYSQF